MLDQRPPGAETPEPEAEVKHGAGAPALDTSERRRLVTFAIFAYNHERFIAEAVRGALAQTYTPLEIIISDDSSTDRTFEIIQEQVAGYDGPHEIRVNRNDPNVGFGASINRVVAMAQGQLIVAASADDVSLPNRVEVLYQSYAASGGNAMSVFSNAIVIDKYGNRKGLHFAAITPESLTLSHIARRLGGVLGATHVWDRRVFEVFGPIIEKKVVAEDLIIAFRSALLGEVKFVEQPLVLYRLHDHNAHFKAPEDVKPHELTVTMRELADVWIDVCEERLKDLETMSKRFPERREELLHCRNDVLSCLREMEDHKALLSTTSSFKRLRIIWRALRQGVRLRAIIRWILTFFFPSLYLSYQKYQRAKGHGKADAVQS